ncbi:Diacylglycerol kinase [Leminorella richardii]|uniref:Diacylglycerol kinase n=1 Tax=Leminorella richardii TaxID=158841 RepID=A0A2X4XW66_9GAMM|nr:diacylglycerol kinase [Leminorella richardii]SQI40884.1 Diacylglycerol kinase [Leminorella richardii]
MNKVQEKGFVRIVKAAGYSRAGLVAAWKNEAAFRQECLLSIVGCAVALWLNVPAVEKILLMGSVILVVIVELLNSAIEAVVDRIGYEHHELSGRAKDIGSAAVLVSLILAAIVWGGLLLPKLGASL